MAVHPRLQAITARIRERSRHMRASYLAGVDAARGDGPQRR